MAILEIFVAASVICIALVLRYLLKNRGYLETLGIPIVKPFLIFGSPPFAPHKMLIHEHTQEMHKKLGKTWAKYEGREATIVTIDPELIKSIMVKNFDSFSEIIDWGYPDNKITLDLSGGEQWKALRKVLSPTFTSGKLKSMLEPMDAVLENMLKHIGRETKTNPVISVRDMYQSFALDTISVCAFGIDTNSFENSDNQILEWGKTVFSGFKCTNWIETGFFNLLSHFTYLNRYIDIYPPSFGSLFNVTKQIMDERKEKNIVKDDFIGRLNEIMMHLEAPLSADLITAQGVIFFVAGFETTANTLSTLSYNLAKHPEIQEKIYEEIQEALELSGGKLDHETILNLNYLEAAINENLRLYGPATDNFRLCSKDIEINGIKFRKGTRVLMPVYPVHHSEEYFPEPEKFLPERFLKENSGSIAPFTFRAFGGGSRQCIGQRFAMNEMKACMAKLLAKFRLEMAPETKLEFEKGSFFLLIFKDIKIKFVARE